MDSTKDSKDDEIDNLVENISTKLIIKVRPTFIINNNPIRAAGILCYVYDNIKKKRIWLMRKEDKTSSSYFCDTGGKTDSCDKSPVDTAIRETVEETNGHLFSKNHTNKKCSEILKELFDFKSSNKDIKSIYSKEGKYILYLLKLRYNTINKSLDRFGRLEKSSGGKNIKSHAYFWLDELPFEDLHPRLLPMYKQIISKKN